MQKGYLRRKTEQKFTALMLQRLKSNTHCHLRRRKSALAELTESERLGLEARVTEAKLRPAVRDRRQAWMLAGRSRKATEES